MSSVKIFLLLLIQAQAKYSSQFSHNANSLWKKNVLHKVCAGIWAIYAFWLQRNALKNKVFLDNPCKHTHTHTQTHAPVLNV